MRVKDTADTGFDRRQALVKAIDQVRKKGVHCSDPHFDEILRELLSIPESMPDREAQSRVRKALLVCAGQIPNELTRETFILSAGLRGDPERTTGERIHDAAKSLSISKETVYRALRSAVRAVADQLLSQDSAPALEDVDFLMLRSVLRADLRHQKPILTLERTILAHRENLSHIDERMWLPRLTGASLDYRGIHSCTTDQPTSLGSGTWTSRVRFETPLHAGEQRTFVVSLHLPDHDSMEPLIGHTPVTRSLQAEVQLLFGERKPVSLTKHADVYPVGSYLEANAEAIEPIRDKHRFAFSDMKPGYTYFIRWKWDHEEPSH